MNEKRAALANSFSLSAALSLWGDPEPVAITGGSSCLTLLGPEAGLGLAALISPHGLILPQCESVVYSALNYYHLFYECTGGLDAGPGDFRRNLSINRSVTFTLESVRRHP